MLFVFPILVVLNAVSLTAAATPPSGFGYVSTPLQNVLSNTHGSDLYSYPTDFTRGIVPVSWLTVPLRLA